jgi:hypothetical protein
LTIHQSLSIFTHLSGKLRLFGSANVIAKAEEVMQRIVETYAFPNIDFRKPDVGQEDNVDLLRAFSEACWENLRVC